MRLQEPLLQLPIRFCAETLAAEVRALPDSAWTPHPTGFVGNEAVALVSPGGTVNDGFDGPMAATASLRQCAYISEVLGEIGAVWGRSRLMALAPGAQVPPHADTHYYWRTHHRIHIPVITNQGVTFTVGGQSEHMQAGDCWMFDSFRAHNVQNQSDQRRIHLVADTVGGGRLSDLMEQARSGTAERRLLVPGSGSGAELLFEQVNSPRIMSPWEIRCHVAFIFEHVVAGPQLDRVAHRIDRFVDDWAAAWARFGPSDDGLPTYRAIIAAVRADLDAMGGQALVLDNDLKLYHVLSQLIFVMAAAPAAATRFGASMADGRRLAS